MVKNRKIFLEDQVEDKDMHSHTIIQKIVLEILDLAISQEKEIKKDTSLKVVTLALFADSMLINTKFP